MYFLMQRHGHLDNIRDVLTEKKIEKELEMVKIEERATRYKRNIVGNTGNTNEEGVETVATHR